MNHRLRRLTPWGISLAVAVVFAAVVTGRSALVVAQAGRHIVLGRTFVQMLLMFVPWVVAAPVIVQRSAASRGGWRLWLAAVSASPVFAAIAFCFAVGVYAVMADFPFGEAWTRMVANTSPLDVATDLGMFLGMVGVGRYMAHRRALREHALREAQLLAANAELHRSLSEAQLQSLTSRVRPHFLYNALNAAVGLLRTGDSANAIEMLTGIAALFRRASSERQPLVALADEMEMINAYLLVERYRVGERLRVSIDLSPEAADVPVPSLILQPLVENAIRHGVAERDDVSDLAITARVAGTRCTIVVSNDATPALPLRTSNDGQGLRLTRERLARHYGDDATFTIEGEGGVVRVTLEVPNVPPA